MHSTIMVAKTKMEYPPVQVVEARGLTIGPEDTPAVPRLPPQPPPPQATWISHPQVEWAPSPHVWTTQKVEYYIPLDKAWARPRDMTEDCIPLGSAANPGILLRLASPSTPFEFPFDMTTQMYGDFNITDGLPLPLLKYSVLKVIGLPRVCGLAHNNDIVVTAFRTATNYNNVDIRSLIDGGANICITGLLDLLVEVVSFPPLPTSVATKTGGISMDDWCTKKGLLPLTLEDGSFYYQPCYYCKNAIETIISLQAILAASDVLGRWTQMGHKDGSPGTIRFDSDSGLFSITMTLEKRDGLYYCPTDVFTVDRDTVHCNVPSIHRAVVDTPPM
jgi:hypothetical protein